MWALQGVLVLSLSAVLWRVHDVQHVYGKSLEKKAANVVDVTRPMLAARGSILDAQGNQLAYDVPAFYVDLKTSSIRPYAASVANVIAPILGTSAATLQSLLASSSAWIQLPHTVIEQVKEQLQLAFDNHTWAPTAPKAQWEFDVTFTPTEQRVYPYHDFLANTIGYVSNDGVGESGVELEYNQLLTGKSGMITYQQDPTGDPLPGSVKVIQPAQPGDNVQLTIDDTIQGYVEHEMDSVVNKYKPEHAAIIVMNPKTGAILGMSSRPTFDPNQYWAASATALSSNWAVSSAFEPGSTFKPFVLSAALATHSISLSQTFKSGQTQVAGHTINDWNWGIGWGTLTFQQALEYSSNVGFTKIATALGWPNMDHYLNLFGFLNKTGIDLPNEVSSIMFPQSDQGAIQLATTGFGQGIAVTPLQQVAAMSSIANGGKLMRPYVTKQITTPSGQIVEQSKPTVVRQNFIPQSVLDQVAHTMVLDVSGKDGIDTLARIPGYEVAGKTGTAQIVNPKTGQYYTNRFETSFIGFAPAQDPKVLVYVTLYWPKTPPDQQWGSTVATPPAKDILQDCLEYYHIPPNGAIKTVATDTAGQGAVQYVQTPSIVGKTQQAAASELSSLGLNGVFTGSTGTVLRQWPAPGIQVAKGSKMYGMLQTSQKGTIVMPNLVGLSLRDATNLLAALGLSIQPSGTGYVTAQSASPGTNVASGATIAVTLSP